MPSNLGSGLWTVSSGAVGDNLRCCWVVLVLLGDAARVEEGRDLPPRQANPFYAGN